jgi:phage terminase large subunit-like protein
MINHNIENLSRKEKEILFMQLEELEEREHYNFRKKYFTDDGPNSRDRYPKHIAWMNAGNNYKVRVIGGGNRSGKSTSWAYEFSFHATKDYPHWWEGKRAPHHSITIWICSVNNTKSKEVAQELLLGKGEDFGSGMLPKADPKDPRSIGVVKVIRHSGVTGLIDTVHVRDTYGNINYIKFKSYEEGTQGFYGAKIWGLVFDEEPETRKDPNFSRKLFSEAMLRLAGTEGIAIIAFTPKQGITSLVTEMLNNGNYPPGGLGEINGRFVANITWDDIPTDNGQLSVEDRETFIRDALEYEIEAITKGIPAAGSGRIYPLAEKTYICEPFPIPPNWQRYAGMDVGWHCTSAVFFAMNPETKISYIYSVYKAGGGTPSDNVEPGLKVPPVVYMHSRNIKLRGGDWMTIAIDPASKGRGQSDGRALFDMYSDEGLDLIKADNTIETGIRTMYSALLNGELKIFDSADCEPLIKEMRIYRYDEKTSKPAKPQDDHACDAMRYGYVTAKDWAHTPPEANVTEEEDSPWDRVPQNRDKYTGY